MAVTLLDLHPDALNHIAHYLPPPARLRFAQTCRRVHAAVWGRHAQDDLIRRYPIERRVFFSLDINLPSNLSSSALQTSSQTSVFDPIGNPLSTTPPTTDSVLRTVPARSRQQHLNVAVHPNGTLVAVLPYDNVLRLVCPRAACVISETPLEDVFANDVWDVTHGLRRPSPRPDAVMYADDAGLDIETCLEFSADGSILLVSCRHFVQLFQVQMSQPSPSSPTTASLKPVAMFPLKDAIDLIQSTQSRSDDGHPLRGSGGAATLSADACNLAWVVFVGTPATVYVSRYSRDHADAPWRSVPCEKVYQVWNRRWTALAWARPFFTPNSKLLSVVVNSAHKVTRVVNVDGEFRRSKLCRFEIGTFPVAGGPMSHRTHWIDLAPDVYPRAFARAVVDSLSGCVVHDVNIPFAVVGDSGKRGNKQSESFLDEHNCKRAMGGKGIKDGNRYGGVSCKAILRMPGLALNSVHSCPAEATYKALSFGKARHPWFVSKQPMFSFHFDPCGESIMLATSPHTNQVRMLSVQRKNRRNETSETESEANAIGNVPSIGGGTGINGNVDDGNGNTVNVGNDSCELDVVDECLIDGARAHVFRSMPWRTAFAAVTSFSTSGQWLAGAALLDNDRCCVCVRNVTLREYFGAHGE